MSERHAPDSHGGPAFEVTHTTQPSDVLLMGISNPALASLTAVDFLVERLELDQIGHVTVDQFPAITPFENGSPRHHTRIFSAPSVELTVLTGELFVPPSVAGPFGEAVFEWLETNDVSEVAVLAGVPVPHGPEEHRTFYVATDDYREHRLEDVDVQAMGGGFLDGVNAELMARGIDSDLRVGVYVTPVHAQTPDVEAALRLIDAVRDVYDVDVDTEPLESFAADVEQYYRDLADRIETEESRPATDRMFM